MRKTERESAMKLICWMFGHRTRWAMNKKSGTMLPQCERCKKQIATSKDLPLDSFYI